jgi:molecular chaperone GrpE
VNNAGAPALPGIASGHRIMDDNQNETSSDLPVAMEESPQTAVGTDEVRRQRDEYYDLLLRKTAEFDNYRKRTDRERVTLAESAARDLIKELLPLVDDMERALKVDRTGEGAEAYRRGVELIQRQLMEILRKRGVRPIEALGADFDPNVHEAVTQEESAQHREGEVMEELQRGYKVGDRLLRPAMVKVAKRA